MADIKINGATPSAFYVGSTAASAVYYGSSKLWEAAPPTPPAPYNVIGGKTYPTCTLPDGHEWLAVNLDYAWPGLSVPTSGTSYVTTPQAMYYNNDEATYGWNGLKRGLLYNNYAVTELEANKATLCPGWHVPTHDEIEALFTAVGGKYSANTLKSTTGWDNSGNGTDDYGFAGYPSGYLEKSGFQDITAALRLWGAWNGGTYAYALWLKASVTLTVTNATRSYQYSLRLIRDY